MAKQQDKKAPQMESPAEEADNDCINAQSGENENTLTLEYLEGLKRKELLGLCKERGIKASGKNSELIEKLLNNDDEGHESEDEGILEEPRTPAKSSIGDLPPKTPLRTVLESVKKTGLSGSPMRIPFGQSPLGKLQLQAHGSPKKGGPTPFIIAKEPSSLIKEAWSESGTMFNHEAMEEKTFHNIDSSVLAMMNSMEQISGLAENITTITFVAGEEGKKRSASIAGFNEEDQEERNHEIIDDNEFEADEQPQQSIDEAVTSLSQSKLPRLMNRSESNPDLKDKPRGSALLPSGILKLLEKKKQESQQHNNHHPNQSNKNQSSTIRRNFDLKASLQRPLTYKPHLGPMSKASSTTSSKPESAANSRRNSADSEGKKAQL